MNQIIIKYCILFQVGFLFFSCNSFTGNDKVETPESKITELGNRYYDLGRFSGKILIQKEGLIYYENSFGYANNITKEKFTEETTFNLGHLSFYFMNEIQKDIVTNSLRGMSAEQSKSEALIKLSNDLNLQHSFFTLSENNKSAISHEYKNLGDGFKWYEFIVHDSISNKITEIYSTPHDFLKLTNSLSDEQFYAEVDGNKSGFNYLINKKPDYSIIIFSNAKHPITKELNEGIESILKDSPYYLPLPRKEVKVDTEILNKYEGIYKIDTNRSIKVSIENDSLFTYFGPSKLYMTPQSDNQFFMQNADAEIRFITENKQIKGVELLDGFKEGRFVPKVN